MHFSQNFLCIYRTLFWGPQNNFQLLLSLVLSELKQEAKIWNVSFQYAI